MSAPWRVVLTASAKRDLNRLPAKAMPAIEGTLVALQHDPGRQGKPLSRELAGLLSARRGPYRVLYRLDLATRMVAVVAIGHRADVYRRR